MRSAGSYGGFYAAMSRHYDQKYDSEAYRIQEAKLFAQSRAGHFFRLCHQTWEGMGGNGKGIIDDVVCVVLDGTKLTSLGSSFTDAVKITALWIEHEHRSKGIGREVLAELTAIADESGCVLIAVSNPFDYPDSFTAKDALADTRKSELNSEMFYVKYGYRKRQARMNNILKSLGFRNIDICEDFQNKKRCRVQDTWAYIPDNYARHLDWGERGLMERLKD
ncbi:hypothetical protein N9D38_11255 [Rubripirellula sp.]|nr:hypothetical protein [Rubripirellula sp.]